MRPWALQEEEGSIKHSCLYLRLLLVGYLCAECAPTHFRNMKIIPVDSTIRDTPWLKNDIGGSMSQKTFISLQLTVMATTWAARKQALCMTSPCAGV